MNRVLCSTGAVITRKNNRNYRLLPILWRKLKCDGFEFMMYDSFYDKIDEIASFLTETEIIFPAFHCEKTIGEFAAACDKEAFTRFEKNCRAAKLLGSEMLVLHLWNGIVSDSNFAANLEAFRTFSEIAEEYELYLTVENVVCNNGSPMEHLREISHRYPHAAFTFDTKMAAFHGELSAVYDEAFFQKHIKHLHINDFCGAVKDWSRLKTLHPGCGKVDFDSFFDFVKRQDYGGDFTVEATSVDNNGLVDINKLNEDFRKIKGYIA